MLRVEYANKLYTISISNNTVTS
uniref:SCAN domaincontaining protein 3like [Mesocricetus auratus] n=1 Tax=Lepeophtheirus salmonis TaxID=72036 RepID=A0A0K2SY51_LEPSM